MKLRTSYFNGTVLKKDITRFAPVWALYTIFQVLVVVLLADSDGTPALFAANAPYIMQAMSYVNFAYAGLCAVLLFGDLFNPRMCNALHALPLRREGWFLTHTCAGLLFCLVPNLLGALVAALMLQVYSYLAFLWLAVMLLQFLFFFGVGAFSVMCAGNRLGATAVYAIINLLAVIATWLVTTFYEPLLFGVSLDFQQFSVYSPVVAFSRSQYIMAEYDNMMSITRFLGFLEADWTYLFVAAAVGLALLALAVLIYRTRKLETAGDFISLPAVAPVFLVIYTLCAAAVMYYLADIFSGAQYVFLAVGLALGFFTGCMLLERKVNVFRRKTFLRFGILATVFAITVAMTWLDPLGITRYVPDSQDIRSVCVYHNWDRMYGRDKSPASSAANEIRAVRQLHSQILEARNDPQDGETVQLCFQYQLNNGAVLSRYYNVAVETPIGQALEHRFSRFSYLFHTEDPAALTEAVSFVEVTRFEDGDKGTPSYCYKIHEKDVILQLLEAVKQDCDAGTMAESGLFHRGENSVGYLLLVMDAGKEEETVYRHATIYQNSIHIQAFWNSYIPDPDDIYK